MNFENTSGWVIAGVILIALALVFGLLAGLAGLLVAFAGASFWPALATVFVANVFVQGLYHLVVSPFGGGHR